MSCEHGQTACYHCGQCGYCLAMLRSERERLQRDLAAAQELLRQAMAELPESSEYVGDETAVALRKAIATALSSPAPAPSAEPTEGTPGARMTTNAYAGVDLGWLRPSIVNVPTAPTPTPAPEPTQPLDVEAIRGRCDGATPGPWRVGGPWPSVSVYSDQPEYYDPQTNSGDPAALVAQLGDTTRENCEEVADAQFIAHARQDIPALLAEIARLRAAPPAEELTESVWLLRLTDDNTPYHPGWWETQELAQEARDDMMRAKAFREGIALEVVGPFVRALAWKARR